jgi:hypothetical protein
MVGLGCDIATINLDTMDPTCAPATVDADVTSQPLRPPAY